MKFIGASQEGIQIQFRCTPVKCHRLTSMVTMEAILTDINGNVVSKPNQSASMHFRSVSNLLLLIFFNYSSGKKCSTKKRKEKISRNRKNI